MSDGTSVVTNYVFIIVCLGVPTVHPENRFQIAQSFDYRSVERPPRGIIRRQWDWARIARRTRGQAASIRRAKLYRGYGRRLGGLDSWPSRRRVLTRDRRDERHTQEAAEARHVVCYSSLLSSTGIGDSRYDSTMVCHGLSPVCVCVCACVSVSFEGIQL